MFNTVKMKMASCFFGLLVMVLAGVGSGCAHLDSNYSAKDSLKYSIVRISATVQQPYFYSPWVWQAPQRRTGQGVVVGKDLVLTLASVVKNAKLVEMTLDSEPLPTPMKVVAIDTNANVALLKGNLPDTVQPVNVPATARFIRGGMLNLYWKTADGMIVEGNASVDRVETNYNPGSFQALLLTKAVKSTHPNMGYGVPVFDADNNFYGLAVHGGDEYAFYIITSNIINRVIDFKKGVLREPTAVAGFSSSVLNQVYYRKKLGLKENNGGCLISKVFGQGSGSTQLKEGDVLLSICGHHLDSWGRYEDPVYGKLTYTHFFSEHHISDDFPVTIMRDKKIVKLNLKLSGIDESKWLIPTNSDRKPTEYIVRGGFIFVPLTKTYLQEWGISFINKAPAPLVSRYNDNQYKVKSPDKKEFVVLSRVLSHPTNIGLQSINNCIIDKVNGKPLKSLKELDDILNDMSEDEIRFTLYPGDTPLLLSKKVLKSADAQIQKRYGINAPLENIK